MSVDVHIIDGPLGPPTPWDHADGYGASVVFEGIVGASESRLDALLALLERMSPLVLWLDEIDKSDPDVPNNLLVPLGSIHTPTRLSHRARVPVETVRCRLLTDYRGVHPSSQTTDERPGRRAAPWSAA